MAIVNDKTRAPRRRSLLGTGPIRRLRADGTVPLYEAVKRQVSEAILLGKWAPGTVLPNEVSLAQTFGVAVGTVRRALNDLTAEGLLSRRRKTGTIVTGRSPNHSLRFFFQYFRLHGIDGSLQRSHARVLSLAVEPATSDERARLKLADGARVLRLHRTRNIDERPVMHERIVLPAHRVPDFPRDPARVPELLYLHLLERYGIRISAVREQLSADLGSDEDLALLGLTPPAAVLTIDEIAYDQASDPILLATHLATTRAHRYVNEVR
jgi:GntR family transcriptional regulator